MGVHRGQLRHNLTREADAIAEERAPEWVYVDGEIYCLRLGAFSA